MSSLAIWANRFSPIVHVEDEQTLFLDVTGCARLFGGEDQLAAVARTGLSDMGCFARAAIADTPGAVWALAHAGEEDAIVVPAGRSAVSMAPLPVWSLRIDARAAEDLVAVGVHTIGALLHLPRASLATRFGESLLTRIDQALGDVAEPLIPFAPPRAISSTCRLGAPTDRLDILTDALGVALGAFCRKLDADVIGVRQMYVAFHCPIVEMNENNRDRHHRNRFVTESINLSRPTRSISHLQSLLRVLLDQVRLPAGADAVTVWARETESMDDPQHELFVTDQRDGEAVADLLDRLAARLGHMAVVRPELMCDYEPERRYRYVPVTRGSRSRDGGKSRAAPSTVHRSAPARSNTRVPGKVRSVPPGDRFDGMDGWRPLRLLRRPLEIGVTTLASEDSERRQEEEKAGAVAKGGLSPAPRMLRFHGCSYEVIADVGPERIETGWWRGPHTRRDYYRVLISTGRRLWIFRNQDTDRWFLHGWM
ncbi:MAG: Y-family DNA polymerase [Planctomycetota bacterium]